MVVLGASVEEGGRMHAPVWKTSSSGRRGRRAVHAVLARWTSLDGRVVEEEDGCPHDVFTGAHCGPSG